MYIYTALTTFYCLVFSAPSELSSQYVQTLDRPILKAIADEASCYTIEMWCYSVDMHNAIVLHDIKLTL